MCITWSFYYSLCQYNPWRRAKHIQKTKYRPTTGLNANTFYISNTHKTNILKPWSRVIGQSSPMAWARAMTTSWQVVASVTPHTTLWTPSTQTLSSMLGQVTQVRWPRSGDPGQVQRGGLLRWVGPIIPGSSSCVQWCRVAPAGHHLTEEEEHRAKQEGPGQEAHLRGQHCFDYLYSLPRTGQNW